MHTTFNFWAYHLYYAPNDGNEVETDPEDPLTITELQEECKVGSHTKYQTFWAKHLNNLLPLNIAPWAMNGSRMKSRGKLPVMFQLGTMSHTEDLLFIQRSLEHSYYGKALMTSVYYPSATCTQFDSTFHKYMWWAFSSKQTQWS